MDRSVPRAAVSEELLDDDAIARGDDERQVLVNQAQTLKAIIYHLEVCT